MPQTAADVMQRHVITLSADTPLLDAQRLFVEEEINGAPVVDEMGHLTGVVSTTDLLRAAEEEQETAAAEARYFREDLPLTAPEWARATADFQDRLAERTVADVMTAGGVVVAPDAPISEVAGLMRQQRVHRVLVIRGERLVGLISTFDLVALLEKNADA